MNKKGFTLIELLAVIIILGILMIIAIPSVTKYISDSRKSSYVDTAKEIIGSARNLVNSGNLEMYDTDATYYLDVKCIKTENALKSPYGEFVDLGAYVVVTYNGKGYDYYWTSVDDAGQGIKDIVKYDKLDIDNIESDLKVDKISTLRTLDGRGKVILITERNGCKKEGAITENLESISSKTGKEIIEYPEGKTRNTLSVGDLVKIDDQEFYVIKIDNTRITLFAHYNLNVGNYKKNDVPEGIQSPDIRGKYNGIETYGMVPFSKSDYWTNNLGTIYQSDYFGNTYYIYDSNSSLYNYVEQYKSYLNSLGVNVKEARLPKEYYEISVLTNDNIDYTATSFWYGSMSTGAQIPGYVETYINSNGYNLMHYSTSTTMGVRPIIVL